MFHVPPMGQLEQATDSSTDLAGQILIPEHTSVMPFGMTSHSCLSGLESIMRPGQVAPSGLDLQSCLSTRLAELTGKVWTGMSWPWPAI